MVLGGLGGGWEFGCLRELNVVGFFASGLQDLGSAAVARGASRARLCALGHSDLH